LYKFLDRIESPGYLKGLKNEELYLLADELRSFLIDEISKTGGHLASNLGVVELTIAIHRVFNTEKDRLVFDVGHQSYVHKILTGRKDRFDTMRQFGGLAGFPKPQESVHDAFIAGHASNSISVGLGLARARSLGGGDYSVVSLIGDGALTGGLAYEALNDAGESKEPLIIILNDNGMSITPNVGGMAHYLARQRLRPSYRSFKKRYKRFMDKFPGGRFIYRLTHGVKTAMKEAILHCSMFEQMGLLYVGPVSGYDIERLVEVMSWAKTQPGPVLIHVITQKGKGYALSEDSPDRYHSVSKFDPETGCLDNCEPTFSKVFGDELLKLARGNPKICAITAAMTEGTGLERFKEEYPSRFFDVGIAEGHGAAMSAALAVGGMTPVFAVYSTFLQRSYDMLIHDVAISRAHAVFAVDRAGLVGEDGETHHGVFDVNFLSSVPGMTVMCPSSFDELREMLAFAISSVDGPVAVRYPRGGQGAYALGGLAPSKALREGTDFSIVSYGIMINEALKAAVLLEAAGISADVIKLDFINPIDFKGVDKSILKTRRLLVAEDCVSEGSVGQKIAAHIAQKGIGMESLILKNLGGGFVTHGKNEILYDVCGISAEKIAAAVIEDLKNA
jgi:1-deoxy-D-xylulose-5-phosphate synthase